MTKTKRQLRAEAVERVRECGIRQIEKGYMNTLDLLIAEIGNDKWGSTYIENCNALIDLLTDDDDGAGNWTCPDAGPQGDAVEIMRKAAKGFAGGTGHVMNNAKVLLDINPESGCDSDVFNALADMVERERDEAKAELRKWQDGYYLAKLTEAEEERDGWKKVAKQWETNCDELRGENDALREWKACYECMRAERDVWKAQAEQAHESYLDAQSRAEIEDMKRSRAVSGDAAAEVDAGTGDAEKTPQEPREDAREGEADSREKLEAEIIDWAYKSSAVFPKSRARRIAVWLDRQAEITRAEERCRQNLERNLAEKSTEVCDAMGLAELQANNQQLHTLASEQAARIDELQAERDMYRDKLGRAVDAAHEIAKMMED